MIALEGELDIWSLNFTAHHYQPPHHHSHHDHSHHNHPDHHHRHQDHLGIRGEGCVLGGRGRDGSGLSLDRPAGDGADGDGGNDLDFGADGDD